MKKTNRRNFLKTMVSSSASVALFSQLSSLGCFKKKSPPNVILVLADDQGYGDIGAHGSPYVKTPALDNLYAQSVRLDNFHVDPCCSPTRASLLTGQYSARSLVWHTIGGRSLLRADRVTMADVFQANGYRTGIFGKWHLGENYPFRPQDRGFQETLVFGGGAIGSNPDYWGNDYNDDTYYRNGKPKKYKGYCNTVWFNEAIHFIESNRGRPFFCYLPTNVPHAPLIVDEKYAKPYETKVSDRLAHYYGMVTKFDEDMARLQKKVADLGLEDNTIFIYMTDNGPCPWFGGIKIDNDGFVVEGYSAGMRGGKIWGYDNAHRVPCYVRWPAAGIGGGENVQRLTAHFDLFPTLVECCGLKIPENLQFDGISILPLLKNPQTDWPERTIIVQNQRVDFPVKYKEYQVLTEQWRLVNEYQKEIEDMEKFNQGLPAGPSHYITDPDYYELYDIKKDPGERNNVADQHPEIVQELNRRYEAWWADVSRDFDKYSEIIIGSDKENPTVLFSHDAHRKDGKPVWVLHVARDGKYNFKIRRWPKEANKRIFENRKGDKIINIRQAHLVIGNIDSSAKVHPNDKAVEFNASLKAGQTCLIAWFTREKTSQRVSVNYIDVQYLGPADQGKINNYKASNPDDLLK